MNCSGMSLHPPVKPKQGPTGGQPGGDAAVSEETASAPGAGGARTGVHVGGGAGGAGGAPHTWPAPKSSMARISWQHCVPRLE